MGVLRQFVKKNKKKINLRLNVNQQPYQPIQLEDATPQDTFHDTFQDTERQAKVEDEMEEIEEELECEQDEGVNLFETLNNDKGMD